MRPATETLVAAVLQPNLIVIQQAKTPILYFWLRCFNAVLRVLRGTSHSHRHLVGTAQQDAHQELECTKRLKSAVLPGKNVDREEAKGAREVLKKPDTDPDRLAAGKAALEILCVDECGSPTGLPQDPLLLQQLGGIVGCWKCVFFGYLGTTIAGLRHCSDRQISAVLSEGMHSGIFHLLPESSRYS